MLSASEYNRYQILLYLGATQDEGHTSPQLVEAFSHHERKTTMAELNALVASGDVVTSGWADAESGSAKLYKITEQGLATTLALAQKRHGRAPSAAPSGL